MSSSPRHRRVVVVLPDAVPDDLNGYSGQRAPFREASLSDVHHVRRHVGGAAHLLRAAGRCCVGGGHLVLLCMCTCLPQHPTLAGPLKFFLVFLIVRKFSVRPTQHNKIVSMSFWPRVAALVVTPGFCSRCFVTKGICLARRRLTFPAWFSPFFSDPRLNRFRRIISP